MANLQHLKASRTKVLKTFPTNSFGNDGDIVISMIPSKGIYLCTKAGGEWHSANKMKSLHNLGNTGSDSFIAKDIKVKSMKNAITDTDKFVVLENNNLRYRNSEELLSDLDSDALSINYKTAYCSLGQYNNKEECESGGGTWYYSENDSHDSLSNVAENELMTVGSSIGKVDAESTLTYDGSTLEIKYNSEFDDNWQTSAQTNLLKLSYDSSNYSTFDVGSGGNLTLDSNGSIALSADGGGITMDDGAITIFNFDVDNCRLTISDDANTSDFFRIAVGAEGATTLSTYDADTTAGHLKFDVDGDATFELGGDNLYLKNSSDVSIFNFDTANEKFVIYSPDSIFEYFIIDAGDGGNCTISTNDSSGGSTAADLTLDIDGKIILDPANAAVEVEGTLKLKEQADANADGAGYGQIWIHDDAPTTLYFTTDAGDDIALTNGTAIATPTVIGFTQNEPTFNATDTIVTFSTTGNKQKLTLTNNCTDIHFKFPAVSGNFICVLLQDGTGGRTISNWKTQDSAGNAGAGNSGLVLWAGGTAPSNTETADKSDIASFYWDADNEIAYGTYTYNF